MLDNFAWHPLFAAMPIQWPADTAHGEGPRTWSARQQIGQE